MEVSIIIPSFNTKKLTLACVESVFGSRPKISFEVIIVDNGSGDGSVEALRAVFGKKIKVVKNKENLGFAKAVNIGIKYAKGKSVLLLNSDTQVMPYTIESLVNFAKKTNRPENQFFAIFKLI